MKEELIKILKMIEERSITAQEGQKLIEAIQISEKTYQNFNAVGHFLKIDILSTHSGEDTSIQIKFPLNLAKDILKMGIVQKQITDKMGEKVDLDIEKILALIDSNVSSELMSLSTKESKIRIWME